MNPEDQSITGLTSVILCPKCDKPAIVSYSTGVYTCLNCDFERDLSTEVERESRVGWGELVFSLAGLLVTFALIL